MEKKCTGGVQIFFNACVAAATSSPQLPSSFGFSIGIGLNGEHKTRINTKIADDITH